MRVILVPSISIFLGASDFGSEKLSRLRLGSITIKIFLGHSRFAAKAPEVNSLSLVSSRCMDVGIIVCRPYGY